MSTKPPEPAVPQVGAHVAYAFEAACEAAEASGIDVNALTDHAEAKYAARTAGGEQQ